MKIIVDTNILLFLLFDESRLSSRETEILLDEKNDIIISSISLFEISLKYSINMLKLINITPDRIPDLLIKNGYKIENIDYMTFSTFYKLPSENHKDPFDRLLIWESIQKGFHVLTKDTEFKKYEKFGLKIID
jgi:PIN domain nuclease of toxin-antitoxin system